MELRSYECVSFPVEGPARDMTRKQAKENFNWFVGNLSERVDQLKLAMGCNGGDGAALDLTCGSLAALGVWMEPWLELRRQSPDEFEADMAKLPEWARDLPKPGFVMSHQTMALCYDAGIYFGETMRNEHPQLGWQLMTRSRRLVDYQLPVLGPFKNKLTLDPLLIVNVAVLKVGRGVPLKDELVRIFREWEKDLE